MQTIEMRAKVGKDGTLHLNLPLGEGEAEREVIVTVRPAARAATSPEEWQRFVTETRGAWQGEPLVRPGQGEYEKREDWG